MSTIALDTTTTAPRPQLRLTRRGRVVIGALLAVPVAVALALSALAGAPAQAGSSASGDAASLDYITVAAGESLWDLAGWVAPEADPREVVAEFVALNRISETSLQPGQRLAIPTRYAD